MKYVIDSDHIKILNDILAFDSYPLHIKTWVNLVENLQPIEEIASGEVKIYDDFDLDITCVGIDGMEIHNSMNKFVKLDGKSITIYIQEVK